MPNTSLAVELRFAPQNYTVTEGDAVTIMLEAVPQDPSIGYGFDFTVNLLYMNGTATGECAYILQ